jgi:hypothetical protein
MTFGNPAAIAGVELVVLRLGRLLYSSVVYPVSSCALADIERLHFLYTSYTPIPSFFENIRILLSEVCAPAPKI